MKNIKFLIFQLMQKDDINIAINNILYKMADFCGQNLIFLFKFSLSTVTFVFVLSSFSLCLLFLYLVWSIIMSCRRHVVIRNLYGNKTLWLEFRLSSSVERPNDFWYLNIELSKNIDLNYYLQDKREVRTNMISHFNIYKQIQ